jgi:hypothetical protein
MTEMNDPTFAVIIVMAITVLGLLTSLGQGSAKRK